MSFIVQLQLYCGTDLRPKKEIKKTETDRDKNTHRDLFAILLVQ